MEHCKALPKTFRIAMSTCVRNELSSNVMQNASDLMDVMQARLPVMDVKTCIMWMNLAMSSPHCADVYNAIERVGPQNINLARMAERGTQEEKENIIALLKLMTSCADRLKEQRYFKIPEQWEELALRKAKWSALIERFGKGGRKEMSDEEIHIYRKGKKLERFARKKETLGRRMKREGVPDSTGPRPRRDSYATDDSFATLEHELTEPPVERIRGPTKIEREAKRLREDMAKLGLRTSPATKNDLSTMEHELVDPQGKVQVPPPTSHASVDLSGDALSSLEHELTPSHSRFGRGGRRRGDSTTPMTRWGGQPVLASRAAVMHFR
jgi:hypothetical protein